ncbi:hypothetical protein [Shewanella sp.]|uniref:hypothetical protein n=1 Tax=Shewanella sp. TaxID=50422 RepID=UPI000ED42D0F|nr:hypothetical protein [Shewanella sp.]HCD13441.1 hypothetical protein [Shewanella sp.]
MKRILLPLLLNLLWLNPASAETEYQLQRWQNPVPTGGYVQDIPAMLQRAVTRDSWELETAADGTWLARLNNYKGYTVEVEVARQAQELQLNLLSSRCDCKMDQAKIDSWLIRLRRNIALEVTKAARDESLRQKLKAKY